jgi:hypothetical protein
VNAPEPFFEWWCQRLVAQFTARPFQDQHAERERAEKLAAAKQRAEQAEADVARLQRVLRATRHGILLPWMNAYPVP